MGGSIVSYATQSVCEVAKISWDTHKKPKIYILDLAYVGIYILIFITKMGFSSLTLDTMILMLIGVNSNTCILWHDSWPAYFNDL